MPSGSRRDSDSYSMSQGALCPMLAEGRPEDARKDAHVRGRSHAKAWFMKYPG
jgi:hypothetical protein